MDDKDDKVLDYIIKAQSAFLTGSNKDGYTYLEEARILLES